MFNRSIYLKREKTLSLELGYSPANHAVKASLPLQPTKINRLISLYVSAKVIKAFSYQCRNTEETNRLWHSCKVSIGKRCQHLRKNEKQNSQNYDCYYLNIAKLC